MSEAFKIPPVLDVAEFLDWDAPEPGLWQLVDGEPRAMAPANLTHNGVLGELNTLIRNHLLARGGPGTIIPTPGVIPRVRARVIAYGLVERPVVGSSHRRACSGDERNPGRR